MVNKTLHKKKDWKAPVSSFFKACVLLFHKVNNGIRRIRKFAEDHLGSLTVIALAGLTLFSILYWDWLHDKEPGSTTVRNLGLIVAAIIAFPLAIWRSIVADRQSKTAQQQSETAQRGLLNERY